MSNKPGRRVANRGKRRPPPQAPARSRQGASWLWVGIGAVVVAAVALGIAVSAGGGDDTDALEVGFAETIGEPLPPYDPSVPDPAVGAPAPDFRAQSSRTGQVVDVDLDAGTAHVIGFFAHWCPHCQAELPEVAAWLRANGTPAGVEVYAVSTSVDSGAPNYPPSSWFEREEWPNEILVDRESGTLASSFGLTGFPYWVVIDGQGRVAERLSGEMAPAELEAFMARAAALG